MTYLEELVYNISTDWKRVIIDSNLLPEQEYKNQIDLYENKDIPIYPKREHIFRCFTYFDVKETKVIILGQDPYHGKDEAMGLCFGINKNMKVPPSLRNIKNELMNDLDVELEDNSLEGWAKQGVLLLNTALSVRHKSPTSNMKLWVTFTDYIIDYVNKNCDKVVFVAWGAFAYKKLENIDKSRHEVIVSSHPSPLSNYKKLGEYPCFKNSKPFSKINDLLKRGLKGTINF